MHQYEHRQNINKLKYFFIQYSEQKAHMSLCICYNDIKKK